MNKNQFIIVVQYIELQDGELTKGEISPVNAIYDYMECGGVDDNNNSQTATTYMVLQCINWSLARAYTAKVLY